MMFNNPDSQSVGVIFVLKRSFFQKTLDKQKNIEYNNTIEPKPMIQKSS